MTSQNLVKSLYPFFLLSLLNFNYTKRNLILFQLYYWQAAVTWTRIDTIIHSAGSLKCAFCAITYIQYVD